MKATARQLAFAALALTLVGCGPRASARDVVVRGIEEARRSAWARASNEELEDWAFESFVARDASSALDALDALAARRPEDARIAFDRGVALEDSGREEEALAAYGEAMRLGEADAGLNALGVCVDRGDSECVSELLAWFEARAGRSSRERVRHGLALEWSQRGGSREVYERVVEADDDAVATCLAHAGSMREALAGGWYDAALGHLASAHRVSLPERARASLAHVGPDEGPMLSVYHPWVVGIVVKETDRHAYEALVQGTKPCLSRAVVDFEERVVPIQDVPFVFDIRRVLVALKERGDARRAHERFLSRAIEWGEGDADVTGAHAWVLVGDLRYDEARGVRAMAYPEHLSEEQIEEFREAFTAHALELESQAFDAYRRALRVEERVGSGHPALVRAAERLRAHAREPIQQVEQGSKVRRGERRITWKKP